MQTHSAHDSGQALPLRLVIIDDHQIVLDGIRAMLAPYRDRVEIVGEVCEPQQAAAVLAEQQPDVVLLDVRLHASSGLDLCAEILQRWPECKVVLLTVYDDEQYLYQALRMGAAGFLLKRVSGGELVGYLARIAEGEVLVDPVLAGRVVLSAGRMRDGEFWPGADRGLTQRESEVLAFLVAGMSNRAVAAKLCVGEETVKTHARAVYRKLGVTDRAGAIALAIRERIFP